MKRKSLLLLSAAFLACALSSPAQEATAEDTTAEKPKTGETSGPNRFWQASVGDGHFMVALDRIVSVSRHQYVLDGAVIVDEVTVDTVGQALARFYFISPITDAATGTSAADLGKRGQELLNQAAGRAGADVQNMVVKKYPDTTHAKALEYRVKSEAELKSLYASVRSAWESGRGRQFSAK